MRKYDLHRHSATQNMKICRSFLEAVLKAIDHMLELEASAKQEVGKV